jgi:hypothetical protein
VDREDDGQHHQGRDGLAGRERVLREHLRRA